MSQQTKPQKPAHQKTKCQQTVLIQNRLGLHARAAIKLVELAQSFDAVITISADDREVTADSVMGLLLLDSAQGQYIDITSEGSQAEQALSAICALIEQKFDEEE
ncbi:HPr family phosphocarrier protein [Vibrio sp.]|uniref:HPr family phosphocarrier protein n=1 Tax=Vibrio sp. TaxID=678 RepID=UPI003AA87264